MNFSGRNLWFGTILATMMVPSCVTIIPQYILFSKLGWLNTFWPIIVPAWFAYPYNVFLFRQFYRTIPPALDEAARIDGATEWQIFAKIIAPLSRPVFITIGLLSGIFWWNEFFLPLVFIQSEALKPVSVGIYSFARTLFMMRWDLVMAIATLMLIVPLLIFIWGRRYITEGIKTTGLK
jgi:multiple sugar transport system permease protein